jgi:hypothetical protein
MRQIADRLKESFATVDPAAVDGAVRTACDSLKDARVQSFLPILVERQARNILEGRSPRPSDH